MVKTQSMAAVRLVQADSKWLSTVTFANFIGGGYVIGTVCLSVSRMQ